MDYKSYLETKHWQKIRNAALKRSGRKCQVCGTKGAPLHVHHNDYCRRGKELAQDLVVLCGDCHALFHKNQAAVEKELEEALVIERFY